MQEFWLKPPVNNPRRFIRKICKDLTFKGDWYWQVLGRWPSSKDSPATAGLSGPIPWPGRFPEEKMNPFRILNWETYDQETCGCIHGVTKVGCDLASKQEKGADSTIFWGAQFNLWVLYTSRLLLHGLVDGPRYSSILLGLQPPNIKRTSGTWALFWRVEVENSSRGKQQPSALAALEKS